MLTSVIVAVAAAVQIIVDWQRMWVADGQRMGSGWAADGQQMGSRWVADGQQGRWQMGGRWAVDGQWTGGGRVADGQRTGSRWVATLRECAKCQPHMICWQFLYILHLAHHTYPVHPILPAGLLCYMHHVMCMN